jgi:3-isopropylmalate dehydratase small subunit
MQKSKGKQVTPALRAEGRAWVINKDNIDTDAIFHNRYLSITDFNEMGHYTFNNLKGFESFSKEVQKGDIVVVGKNFGCGSSRQQAVDCFKSLGISVILAESFGSIYERNAINSALPILILDDSVHKVGDNDILSVDFQTGKIINRTQGTILNARPFSQVQLEIYKKGGLLSSKR